MKEYMIKSLLLRYMFFLISYDRVRYYLYEMRVDPKIYYKIEVIGYRRKKVLFGLLFAVAFATVPLLVLHFFG